jgi:hypothetical protein
MMLFGYISENINRIKAEIKLGLMPCSLLRHWEIYGYYDILTKMGNSETTKRIDVCEKYRISEPTLCRIIKKMEVEFEGINN